MKNLHDLKIDVYHRRNDLENVIKSLRKAIINKKQELLDVWDKLFSIYEWIEYKKREESPTDFMGFICATPCLGERPTGHWKKPSFEDAVLIIQNKINNLTEETGKEIIDKLFNYNIFDVTQDNSYNEIVAEWNIELRQNQHKRWEVCTWDDGYERLTQEIEWLNPCSTKLEAMYKAVIVSKSEILADFEEYEETCDEE